MKQRIPGKLSLAWQAPLTKQQPKSALTNSLSRLNMLLLATVPSSSFKCPTAPLTMQWLAPASILSTQRLAPHCGKQRLDPEVP